MDPQALQKLLKSSPEFQAFVAFLKSEYAKLDSIEQMVAIYPFDKVGWHSIRARMDAQKILGAILAPVLELPDEAIPVNPRDFMVEVDDIGKNE